MSEARDIISLKYSSNITSKLIQEYVLRYQAHHINWNAQMLPITETDPGAFEYLKTTSQDVLGRVQYTYLLNDIGSSILIGSEHDVFYYKGDDAHYSNVNLSPYNNENYPPEDWRLPYSKPLFLFRQGGWLDWIKDKPVRKYGVFGQIVSGKILNKTIEITIGVRHDQTLQRFRGIDKPYKNFPEMIPEIFTPETSELIRAYQPNERRTMKSTNPRLGIVFFLTKDLNIKAMAGTAFKEPSITNQFGSHTYMLAVENPRTIKPEKIRTYELGLDWVIVKGINLRANVYHTKFENQIAYASYGNSTYSNLYSLYTRGFEGELLFALGKNLSGFANYSYHQRFHEIILDKGVTPSPKTLTWFPDKTANFGIRGEYLNFFGSVTVAYMGRVLRRLSDTGKVSTDNPLNYPVIVQDYEPYLTNNVYYRPRYIPAWYSVNLRFGYKLSENAGASIIVNNLFNSYQTLIKIYNLPFDYLREGRTIYFQFDMSL